MLENQRIDRVQAEFVAYFILVVFLLARLASATLEASCNCDPRRLEDSNNRKKEAGVSLYCRVRYALKTYGIDMLFFFFCVCVRVRVFALDTVKVRPFFFFCLNAKAMPALQSKLVASSFIFSLSSFCPLSFTFSLNAFRSNGLSLHMRLGFPRRKKSFKKHTKK